MKIVNSVLGPLSTDTLGFTLMHEHIIAAAACIPQDYSELLGADFSNRILQGLIKAKNGGIDTIVDATTLDLGRDARVLSEVSKQSGVNVIVCTGWWLEASFFLTNISTVTEWQETVLRAVARAHLITSVPIMLHSHSPGRVGERQLTILKDEGVDPRRVKMDHSNDTTDIKYLTWLLEQGCYLGMDRYPGIM